MEISIPKPYYLFICVWIISLCQPGLVYGQEVIKKVHFEGNITYPDLLLKEFIYHRTPNIYQRTFKTYKDRNYYSVGDLDKDIARLTDFYNRRGFLKAEITAETSATEPKKEIYFHITENEPLIINQLEIDIIGDSSATQFIRTSPEFARLLKKQPYRLGKRFEPILLSEVQSSYLEVLKNLGFPFSQVEIRSTVDEENNSSSVNIKVISEKRKRINSFNVLGTTYSKPITAIRESALRKGKWYKEQDIKRAQRELFNHHLYRFATLSLKEGENDSSVTIQFDIREQSPRSIELAGGLGIEQIVRGQVSWVHRNAFQRAHQFTIEAAASFIEQRLSISYLIPWVVNTHSSYVFTPFIRNRIEPGFQLFSRGISNSLIYRASRDFTNTLSYSFTRNEEQLRNRNTQLPDSTQNFDLASLNAGLLFTHGYVQDRRGWIIRFNTELSGNIFEATYPFERFNVDIRHYKPAPWSGGQLAFKFESGLLLSPRAINGLPRNIRFYLGGTSSVRGWNRQQLGPKEAIFDGEDFQGLVPIGGRSMMALSFEFRQEVPFILKGLGMAAFADGGNIWADKYTFEDEVLRWGTGIGLRYASPIGPLRLDFGYQLNPTALDRGIINNEQLENRSRWALHFSLGQAF